MIKRYQVVFYPDKKKAIVPEGETILSAALSCGVHINTACGGQGSCGKCKVIVKEGNVKPLPGSLPAEEGGFPTGVYLACLTSVHGDLEVQVPYESRLDMGDTPKDACSDLNSKNACCAERSFDRAPLSRKYYLKLALPDANDTVSDLDRIYREIKKTSGLQVRQIELSLLRQVSQLLRSSGWEITVTLGVNGPYAEIIRIEPGDTAKSHYGVAFDIGTTTVTAELFNLSDGQSLGAKTSYNRQAAFGPDIITRIVYAGKGRGLDELQKAILQTMNLMIGELVKAHEISPNDITCVFCSGNTVMLHLFLGIDPAYIRQSPYLPAVNLYPLTRAFNSGIIVNPKALVYCAPGISAYVGGDISCGVLSSRLYANEGVSLLIDVGTNGEIALGCKEFIVTCAASAGPAFEGSGVGCGMRAASGAIEKVEISGGGDLAFKTISGIKPKGICGSGYISLISELLKSGLLDKNGKFKSGECKFMRDGNCGREFIVARGSESFTGKDITVSEADIENLKRAKAALYSAVSLLLRHMGLDYAKLEKVFVSGGFGVSLDIESAVHIGLLPDIDRRKFIFMGNSSLMGAKEALFSSKALGEMEDIARKATYFDLSGEKGYMDEYVSALFFPHTDLTKFPSLRG